LAWLVAAFLIWTFAIYWLHRLAHVRAKWNPLYPIHQAHHRQKYDGTETDIKPGHFIFMFGDIKVTWDVLLTQTLPLLIITCFLPQQGLVLLAFHYIYEVFLSEGILDHNPRLVGNITRYFAWGRFHLTHHHQPVKNYSLMITLWDYIFGTAKWKPLEQIQASKS